MTIKMKTTSIKVWCPVCKGEDVKHVEEIIIINGSAELRLECGHVIRERFVF